MEGKFPHIITSGAHVIQVLVPLPFSGAWDGGKGMSAALRAARDWIKYNTTLLPGYSLQLTIKDTKCSASKAVTDFGKSLLSGTKPDLVVGYGW